MLDFWAPYLVSSYSKLPQVPSQTDTWAKASRHAGCRSLLRPCASSRSPSGLQCSSQTPASHHLRHPVRQCQPSPGSPLECTSPLSSLQLSPPQAPSTFPGISCPPTPLSVSYLQPGRGFSEKTQVSTLLSVPQWLQWPQDKSQTPPCVLQVQVYHPGLAPDCPSLPPPQKEVSSPVSWGSHLQAFELTVSTLTPPLTPHPQANSSSFLRSEHRIQQSLEARTTTQAPTLGSRSPRTSPVIALTTLYCIYFLNISPHLPYFIVSVKIRCVPNGGRNE